MPLPEANRLFKTLVEMSAVNVLEIGTFMGRSAWVFCSALQYLGGKRKLVCVDWMQWEMPLEREKHPNLAILARYYPLAYERYFNEMKITEVRQGFNHTLERFPFMKDFVELRICDSQKMKVEKRAYDFVFIDADHDYEKVRVDFETAFKAVRGGGLLCLDDCGPAFPGILRLVSELKTRPDLCDEGSFGKLQFFKKG